MQKEGDALSGLPHRHLTETEKEYIKLVIEKSKLNRERATLVLDKGILLFFAFLVFSVITFENEIINKTLFNVLILAAVCILILSITPYVRIAKQSEDLIDKILDSITGKK